jgi:3',5'-cyclic AMP phosphodiesterase CpdA
MKIAHFPDLHICTLHRHENLQLTRETIEYALRANCDHLVITGDLSHKGGRRDYEILRALFDEYDLLAPEKLSLTIGNHDIFGGVQSAEDILAFPKHCRMIPFNQRVKDFVEFFCESFDQTYRSG